jgi:23S rRNA (adenine2030-N6)-methyltransferase
MLSYRHAFHAGNHADVLKHAVLTLILGYLVRKDKPLWYVDTHAGAGRYLLAGAEAQKNAEFVGGIGRLRRQARRPELLRDYFDIVAACNPGDELQSYPGSPEFAARLLRAQDRLRLFEMHPKDCDALTQHCAGDRRVLIAASDGFTGLKALLPPPPRRALVLIDPPYELKEDYRQVTRAVADAHRRFASGTYMVWYPLLPRPEARQLPERLAALGLPALRAELQVTAPSGDFGLYGSGVFVINPPWVLFEQLEELLPLLRDSLGLSAAAATRLDRLGGA